MRSLQRNYTIMSCIGCAILLFAVFFVKYDAKAAGVPSPSTTEYIGTSGSKPEPVAEFPKYTHVSQERINEIQIQLRGRGYLDTTSGVFDEETSMAIKKFQLDHGLEPNGIIDEETAGLLSITLNNGEGPLYYAVDLEKLAAETDKNYICYVSLSSKTITVFHREASDSWLRVSLGGLKTNQCSIGRNSDLTKVGAFKVLKNSDEKVEKYGLEFYNPTYMTETDMVSSIPYDPSTNTWLVERIGKSETNGDINVSQEMAEFLQTVCEPETYIAIDDRPYNPGD